MLPLIATITTVANAQRFRGHDVEAHSAQAACADTGEMSCADAWGWNCAAPPANSSDGDCATLTHCKGTCSSRYGSATCDHLTAREAAVCSGAGGGGGASEGGCTRGSESKDYSGYKMHFIEARDGAFTQSGDFITVTKERPTPSWCKDTSVKAPKVGERLHWTDFYAAIGAHKLACVGWTPAMHAASTSAYPTCETNENDAMKGVFSYRALCQSAGYFPDFAGYQTYESSALDLASFLAHSSKETMGGTPRENNAWCWLNEMNATKNNNYNYGQWDNMGNSCETKFGQPGVRATTPPREYSNTSVHPYWNAGYWGRGAIQLTHCYNYHFFTNWVREELNIPSSVETDFYTNPGFVATDNWAFAAGLWFYMSPSADGLKPSMHSVVDTWESGALVKDNTGRPSDIGYQVNILNGGIECTPGNKYPQNRLDALNGFMKRMNFPNPQNGGYLHLPQLQTNGCLGSGVQNMAVAGFLYWDVNGNNCPGDSINTCEDTTACPVSAWGDAPVSVVTTTKAPVTTTKAPVTTTRAPVTTTKAPVTTTKAPVTTTKAPVTTTRAPGTTTVGNVGSVASKCCVKQGHLESASMCAAAYGESSCPSTSCVWSAETNCVDHVLPDGQIVPTEVPSSGTHKCCVKPGSMSSSSSCINASESACTTNAACVWAAKYFCVDDVTFN